MLWNFNAYQHSYQGKPEKPELTYIGALCLCVCVCVCVCTWHTHEYKLGTDEPNGMWCTNITWRRNYGEISIYFAHTFSSRDVPILSRGGIEVEKKKKQNRGPEHKAITAKWQKIHQKIGTFIGFEREKLKFRYTEAARIWEGGKSVPHININILNLNLLIWEYAYLETGL